MKILSIIGASTFGNTTEVLRYFKSQLEKCGGYEFEDLYLQDHKIDFCTGCHSCIMLGQEKCPHYLAVKEIEDKMMQADGVILATPGYMFSVSGIMKNFLDHVAYNCHRPKYFGKKIFLISSCTKWQEEGVFIPMKTWAQGAGFDLCGSMYIDMMPFPYSEGELEKRRNKVNEAAFSFDKIIKEKKEIKPEFSRIMIFHAFRTMSAMFPKVMQADYRYFSDKKAYDKNSKWYIPAKIPFFKNFMAGIIEKKMKSSIMSMVDQEKSEKADGVFRNKL